jgi:23S rRNA (pseudouridine1915-N3)-methyltransferase
MRITICAVGRLRSGPAHTLITDYLDRFSRTGRPIGLGPANVIEVEDRTGQGPAAEAALLVRAVPQRTCLWALDERGEQMSSPDFAARLARVRDGGDQLTILIGGADGLDPALRSRSQGLISLGQMVWPHMLVRVMLAEQLYRAATILSGGPYHRA